MLTDDQEEIRRILSDDFFTDHPHAGFDPDLDNLINQLSTDQKNQDLWQELVATVTTGDGVALSPAQQQQIGFEAVDCRVSQVLNIFSAYLASEDPTFDSFDATGRYAWHQLGCWLSLRIPDEFNQVNLPEQLRRFGFSQTDQTAMINVIRFQCIKLSTARFDAQLSGFDKLKFQVIWFDCYPYLLKTPETDPLPTDYIELLLVTLQDYPRDPESWCKLMYWLGSRQEGLRPHECQLLSWQPDISCEGQFTLALSHLCEIALTDPDSSFYLERVITAIEDQDAIPEFSFSDHCCEHGFEPVMPRAAALEQLRMIANNLPINFRA